MDYGQAFRAACRNLAANKARLLHATLAMLIGVAGVVIVLGLGRMQMHVFDVLTDEFAPSVLDMFVQTKIDLPVRVGPEDMEQLALANPEVISGVSPYVLFDLEGGVRYGEKTPEAVSVKGVGSSYLDMAAMLHLQEGRFLEPMDIERELKVCVVESEIANGLLGGDALGKTLKIWGENYTVVGVLAETNIPRLNQEVFIPYTNAQKLIGEPYDRYSPEYYTNRYFVLANGTENMYGAQQLVREMLQERTGRGERAGWYLSAAGASGYLNSMRSFYHAEIIKYLLFAGLVLLIGGAGVMNVMLASVQARIKEIGIRKACGANNQDIRRQFILEAVITSLVGGGLGAVAGLAVSCGICVAGQIPFSYLSFVFWPVLAALGVSVLVGVVFGTYPANLAAKMEIVDAINSD